MMDMFHKMLRWFLLLFAVATLTSHSVQADEEFSEEILSRGKRLIKPPLKPGPFPLRVAIKLNAPYVYIKPYPAKKLYTGFIPELVTRIGNIVGFYPEYHEVDSYGSKLDNGSWTGMIGELIKAQNDTNEGVDLAAADLIITRERQEVVDFVTPFQSMGFTLLLKKPQASDTEYQSSEAPTVRLPVEADVVVVVCVMTLVIGVLLWFMNKFNPYEWASRHRLGHATEHQAETFSLTGSLWFAYTSLVWQGFERAPRSLSAKLLAIFWFVFVTLTLVMVTASLVNCLIWSSLRHHTNRMDHPIENIRDVMNNPSYKLGCVKGSPVFQYFSHGKRSVMYSMLRDYWASGAAGDLPLTNEEGLVLLRNDSKYVLVMETLQAKFAVNQKPCDLMTVGDIFAHGSYGFALPYKSRYLDDFHQAVLQLKESGVISKLEKRWWKDKGECWNQTLVKNQTDYNSYLSVKVPKPVDLQELLMPIVVLFVGMIFSILVCGAETLYFQHRGKFHESNNPQNRAMKMDALEGNM